MDQKMIAIGRMVYYVHVLEVESAHDTVAVYMGKNQSWPAGRERQKKTQ